MTFSSIMTELCRDAQGSHMCTRRRWRAVVGVHQGLQPCRSQSKCHRRKGVGPVCPMGHHDHTWPGTSSYDSCLTRYSFCSGGPLAGPGSPRGSRNSGGIVTRRRWQMMPSWYDGGKLQSSKRVVETILPPSVLTLTATLIGKQPWSARYRGSPSTASGPIAIGCLSIPSWACLASRKTL